MSQLRERSQDNNSQHLSQHLIQESKPDHHYRVEIPHIVFDLNLNVYEFKLYTVIKKIASDEGACWCSNSTLAKMCGFSKRQVINSMASLTRSHEILGDRPLITLQSRKTSKGDFDTNIIIITPIWRDNGDYKRGQIKEKKNKKGGYPIDRGGVVHNMHQGSAQYAPKEEPIKECSKEQQQQPTQQTPVVVVSSVEEKAKKDLLRKYAINEEAKSAYCKFPIQHLRDALLAYQQYCECTVKKGAVIDNHQGLLRKAIAAGWKPNEDKKIEDKKSKDDLIAQNRAIAQGSLIINQKFFTKQFSFSVNETSIMLRYNNSYTPIDLADPECISFLNHYVEANKPK